MTDPSALPNFPPPADEHPLRGRLLDALVDLRIQPRLDDNGTIGVTVREQQLFLRTVDKPMSMVRIYGQWKIGDSVPADELTRLRAANRVTSRVTVVKTTIHDDVLVVSAEYVVNDRTALPSLVKATFDAVLHSVQLWHRTAAGEEDPPLDGSPGPSASGEASDGNPTT